MFASRQSAFAQALRDPAAPVPTALCKNASNSRFAVYRNNVAVGLIGALETRYPALRRIVGDAFFRELSRAFTLAYPPRSPVMIDYGAGFADFLQTMSGVDAPPYLADVARLESARVTAYHAADREPLRPDAFAAVAPDAIDGLRLLLHPSLGLVRSPFPIVAIWAMNAGETPLAPIGDWGGEDALILRPALDVHVRALPHGGGAFVAALQAQASLGEAADAALDEQPEFDLSANLVGLVEAGGVVGLSA